MKDIIKGSSFILFFKVLGSGSFFAITLIISNYYGASYLGIFSLLFALFQMTSLFSRVGLDVFTVKTIPILNDRFEISAFIKKTFRILLTFSLFFSLIVASFSDLIDAYLFKSHDAQEYIYIASFLIVPYSFQIVLPEILRGFDELKYYAILKNALLNLLILIGLVILYKYASFKNEPALALFYAIIAASVVTLTVLIIFLRKRNIPIKSERYQKNILKESFPMFLTASVLFLMSNLDSFMIGYFENEKEVGLYNACLRLSFGISFILGSIKGYVSPKFSKLYYNKEHQKLKTLYRKILLLTWISVFPIILALFLFPEFLLRIFGDEFVVATTALFILNITFSVNTLFGPTGHLLNMTGHQHVLMRIILIAFILNFIGNFFLIPSFGIEGAAMASLISTSFWNLGTFIILKKKEVI